jgi:hypothetical protein
VVFDGISSTGRHEQIFDASALSTGMYFARLETPSRVIATQKVLLLK